MQIRAKIHIFLGFLLDSCTDLLLRWLGREDSEGFRRVQESGKSLVDVLEKGGF